MFRDRVGLVLGWMTITILDFWFPVIANFSFLVGRAIVLSCKGEYVFNVLFVIKLKFYEKRRYFIAFYLSSTGKMLLTQPLYVAATHSIIS